MLCPPRSLEVCSPRFPPIPVATPEPPRSRSSPSASSSFRRCGRQLRPRSRPQERRRWTARGQKGVNLAAAFADELTHILGGVALRDVEQRWLLAGEIAVLPISLSKAPVFPAHISLLSGQN